jgi:alkylhydroperoxidase/carboxymuconolactone decarboxylase family protein YurZ
VLRNDCTIAELKEVVIQSMFYIGIPSAVEAFATIEKIETEISATQKDAVNAN